MATIKNDIAGLHAQLASAAFYGALELKYEAVIVLIRKTDSSQPEPSYGNKRSVSQ